jgi:hypothetical protein
MPAIAVLSEETTFRAVAGDQSSVGRTPGEALDRLLADIGTDTPLSLYIITKDRGDAFFSEAQYQRMRTLLNQRNDGETLSEAEYAELEGLVEAELRAAMQRMAA